MAANPTETGLSLWGVVTGTLALVVSAYSVWLTRRRDARVAEITRIVWITHRPGLVFQVYISNPGYSKCYIRTFSVDFGPHLNAYLRQKLRVQDQALPKPIRRRWHILHAVERLLLVRRLQRHRGAPVTLPHLWPNEGFDSDPLLDSNPNLIAPIASVELPPGTEVGPVWIAGYYGPRGASDRNDGMTPEDIEIVNRLRKGLFVLRAHLSAGATAASRRRNVEYFTGR